ncbi:MAG: DNA-binding protein [Desulfobacteraceae bacterium]|nr:MAG: DNA-binding protein [Desulfobacteraceae bacterium]
MNLNEHHAANRLGLSVQTLRNWRHLCKGPAYIRLGRRIIYREEDLQIFEDSNRIEPNRMAS